MVTKGKEVGGGGGQPFTLLNDDKPVEQLDAWYGKGSGPAEPYTILRGIKVKWSDGKECHAGYCPSDEQDRVLHTSFDFANSGNDPLDWLKIYASTSRVDSLRLVTQQERDYFEAGGIGGDKSIQPAHGRKLCGFEGRAESDIDMLGAIFT
jgi:hypothetical protein